jgi:multiple sugar transport system substrate-binding protein
MSGPSGTTHVSLRSTRPRARSVWTRRAALASTGGALGVLVAACGGATPGPPAASGSAPAAAEGGEVEWSQWGSNADFAIAQAQVDAYNATQPRVRVTANLLTGNYLEKLQAMVSAGTPPDLQHHNSGQFEALAAKKAFRDLEPLIKRDKYRLDDVYPAFLDGVRFTGRPFALPTTGANILLFYNKSLFDKAGRPYPTAAWNWRNLEETARALTGAGASPAEQVWGFYVRNSVSNWASTIWQNGGEIWNAEMSRCLINEPAAVEALDFLYGLKTRLKASPPQELLNAAGGERGLFMSGKLAVNPTGAHQRFEYVAIDGFEWDLQVLQQGKKRTNILFTDMEAIDANAGRPEGAWAFLKWLVADPGQEIRAQRVRAIPSSRKYVETDAFRTNPPGKNNKAIADDMPIGRVPPNANSLFFELNDRWNPELQALYEGTKSAKAAADAMAEQTNALLQSSGGRALK